MQTFIAKHWAKLQESWWRGRENSMSLGGRVEVITKKLTEAACLIIIAAALCIYALCVPHCMMNTMTVWHDWSWTSSNQHLKSESSLPSSASKFVVTKPLVYNCNAYDDESSHQILRSKLSIGRVKHSCCSSCENWTKEAVVTRR